MSSGDRYYFAMDIKVENAASLADWHNSAPYRQKTAWRRELARRMGRTQSCVQNWVYSPGAYNIPEADKPEVSRHTGVPEEFL